MELPGNLPHAQSKYVDTHACPGALCHQVISRYDTKCKSNYSPDSMKLKSRYTGFTLSVCPSFHPSISVLSVPSTISTLYSFHVYTSYLTTSEGVSHIFVFAKYQNFKFWQFFKICNFDFVLFWPGIRYESIVWVIMEWWGVFSECRCSNCSSLLQF